MSNVTQYFLSACVAAALAGQSSAQTLFSDNFDVDSASAWAVFDGALSGPSDYTAQFVFDYSTHNIPPAPNSAGTTRGLKLTVNNNDATGAEAAVSLYPVGQTFSGDFALKFDMWLAYNGGSFGGVGSTEFATFGIHHTGDKVNWTFGPDSDGVWFTAAGEGGATRDYRAYVGDPGLTPVELRDGEGGFLDRDHDGVREFETEPGSGSQLDHIFPSPPFQTRGAPGKRWVQCEIRQRNGLMTWLMNGFVIAEHGNLIGPPSGNIMLGYMDIFASLASPAAENFVIYDNVRVESLDGVPQLPVVSVVASDADATESGGNSGSIAISRTGDTAADLNLTVRITGTASNGVDYAAIVTNVTIAAGSASTTITITPVDDPIGEGPETVVVALLGMPGTFEAREDISATVTIQDDGDKPFATVSTVRPVAYESIPARRAEFQVRLSNPNASSTTVSYLLSGTATNGLDYVTLPGSVSIPAGETNALISIVPLNNTLLDSNRTVVITLLSNAAYALNSSSNATVTIRNDDLPPGGSILFADNFDTDSSGAWNVNKAHADTHAQFGFDYSLLGVPPSPTSANTTLGLKLSTTAALFTGLSVSPAGQTFAGDYRMRFDAWINYNGPINGGGAGSTEALTFGVGTTGDSAQWAGATIHSVMFAVTGDGGSASDYRVYIPDVLAGPATGFYAAGTHSTARNSSDPYYAEFGRESAPPAQVASHPAQTGTSLVGAAGMAWRDMVVIKQGTNVTWIMDGLRIATVNTASITLSSNILVGYFDTANGLSDNPEMSFALIDNLRVEALAAAAPRITAIRYNGGAVEIDFTGDASDVPSAYTLIGAPMVTSAFTPVTGASVTALGSGRFRATAPAAGDAYFYQIRR